MKWISLVLMSFGLSGVVFAQRPVVSATQMNVVYRGIPNPIEVAVPGKMWDELEVSVDSSHTLERREDGGFVLMPSSDPRIHTVEVNVRIPDAPPGEQNLSPVTFRIKRIPDPKVNWLGHSSTDPYISNHEVMAFAPINVRMENFDFFVSPRVAAFTLGVERQGVFKYLQSDSNRITEDMKSALRLAQTGDRIWIGEIKATMPDDTERELAPLLLTLTD